VRDKSKELYELLSDPTALQREREFARQTREKMHNTQSSSSAQNPTSAAPASGKYTGFGSDDIKNLGYNNKDKFNAPYDPYTKAQAAPTQNVWAPSTTGNPVTLPKGSDEA
jgi:hypothetical protein